MRRKFLFKVHLGPGMLAQGPVGIRRSHLTANRTALYFLSLALFLGAAGPDALLAMDAQIVERVEHLRHTGRLEIDAAPIAAIHLIPAFYEARGFTRAWTRPERIEELLELLATAPAEGLDPEDYHFSTLKRLQGSRTISPADHDILLTDALTRYGYHHLFGKVNPQQLDGDWNLSRDMGGMDPAVAIQQAIDSPSLAAFLGKWVDRGRYYERMKQVLAEYHGYQKNGGWPAVSAGETLKPGSEGARVVELRRRLAATGLLDPAIQDGVRFDENLEQAVKAFQVQHDLDDDAVVGPQTLTELNVTVEQRLDQIRVNLERGRWVLGGMTGVENFVLVNIAGFKAMLVRNGEIVWTTRAQVGKLYRKSPVFTAPMKYLVFNPTWTVPPGLLKKDILPQVRKNPGYLADHNMHVIDSGGKEIDPATVDWQDFRYSIRQAPGPHNALGLVKFIFPNPHFVFLHDTPHREYFDRDVRTFSSGCIRIENPMEFARLLLEDQEGWHAEKIQATVEAEETKTVSLSEPLPVLLLYWTLAVEEEGPARFLQDVYDRDQSVLDALNAPFSVSAPSGLPSWAED
ncbi:MAG: hypothetical protein E2P03_11575 [Acidobacteria bacterium]|nr:MAG: hypothetical protein E2P03_11575 [Acidobacteriota bacterium]